MPASFRKSALPVVFGRQCFEVKLMTIHIFDEGCFPPDTAVADDYARHVRLGYEVLKEKRLVFTGLARDVEPILPATIARLQHSATFCRDYRVVVYENDSKDRTKALLESWQSSDPKVHVISEVRRDPVNQQIRCLDRATRMAYYRNRCRAYLLEHFPEFDNVIVLDTDLRGGWSYDGLAHTFSLDGTWDFVGSNGIMFKPYKGNAAYPMQFDVWAWRWLGSYTPCAAFKINPRVWPRGSKLEPLNSCFGGLGVYTVDALTNSSYDGSDCEHVPLHKKMRANGRGRIYMNPSQITVY